MTNKKYKIYEVYISQTFDVFWYEGFLFKKHKVFGTDTANGNEECIIAESKEDAINKYKERYQWEFNCCINHYWEWLHRSKCICNEPNFKHVVQAREVHPSYNTLKEKLRGDDFLAYCKQEMYPIEVLMK